MHTLTLFYDAHCGLCSAFRTWMEQQPAWVRLVFIPYDAPEARRLCPGIEKMQADREIVVLADDGRVWQGAGAWTVALWALREYREWSLRLAAPAMQAVARRIVYWISTHRIGISRLLHLRSDAAVLREAEEAAFPDGSCRLRPRGTES